MSKRQRTFSSSPSTLSKQSRSPSQPPTSDQASGKATTNGSTGGKKVRGVTARSHRDKEVRDRQKELSVQRAEAASKRAARSERRRGEGSKVYSRTSKHNIDKIQTLHHPHLKSRPLSLRRTPVRPIRRGFRMTFFLHTDLTRTITARQEDLQHAVVDLEETNTLVTYLSMAKVTARQCVTIPTVQTVNLDHPLMAHGACPMG